MRRVAGMKQILLMIAVVALVGCGATSFDLTDPNQAVIEWEIRRERLKPTGELTKADLEKVVVLDYLVYKELTNVKGLENLTKLRSLSLNKNQLTDVKSLEKLTKLTWLSLNYNKLTDVKGLEKLKQLEYLDLRNNPDLPKAHIAELQKALPKCKIYSNPTK